MMPITARIAIVGSGPAGCYTAQALRKSLPEAEITVIERLPVPYGLVRYGVAPDHQGTKAVTRQFQRLFEKQNVSFLGNLEIGRDLTLDALRDAMDAVVLATGLYGDRAVCVNGTNLANIYGAGAVTRYWNGHPDDSDNAPDFGKTVAIIGNGNVAMDIARLLAKREGDFAGSDMDPSISDPDVNQIHVVGRMQLCEAKFDVAMLRELATIANVNCSLAPGDEIGDVESDIGAVARELIGKKAGASEEIKVVFHSGWDVASIKGDGGRVSALHLSRPEGAEKVLHCNSIVTAIGFGPNNDLRPDDFPGDATSGNLDHGLFATGWFRRGPRGTIPENRADAQEISAVLVDWLAKNGDDAKRGREALLEHLGDKTTNYNDWCAINDHEIASAASDRCRTKVRTINRMLKVIENARSSE